MQTSIKQKNPLIRPVSAQPLISKKTNASRIIANPKIPRPFSAVIPRAQPTQQTGNDKNAEFDKLLKEANKIHYDFDPLKDFSGFI